MAKRKKQKLSFQRQPTKEEACTAPTASTDSRSQPIDTQQPLLSTPRAPNITDLTNLTFEEFKELNLNENQQRNLIGQIRSELPLGDVDEVDKVLLDSLAKQLRLCIFPTAHIMHIDPAAVKRMLDTEFREAYGLDVEARILAQEGQHERQDSTEPDKDLMAQIVDESGEGQRTTVVTQRKSQ